VPLGEASADQWQQVLAANVVGAAVVVAAAAPALLESEGRAVLLSSRAVRHPFPRLALYSTSKFALDGLIRCLPVEFPGLRVTRVVVGDTTGTEFASDWDPDQLDAAVAEWTDRGLFDGHGTLLEPEQVAATVLRVLPGDSGIDDVAVVGR
jgi:NAD(P)-dependent dehydrogenase (short-subunit alcohol dehydrogenase family)